jgi:SET domain
MRRAARLACQAAIRRRFSSNASTAESEVQLYASGNSPLSLVGPLTVAAVEGRGRGVLATTPVQPGELLLGARPAVIIEGEPDVQPSASLLVQPLARAGNAVDVVEIGAALLQLHDGTARPLASMPDIRHMMERPLLGPEGKVVSGAADQTCQHASGSGSCEHHHQQDHQTGSLRGTAGGRKIDPRISLETAEAIVRYNAFGDDYEDLAAAAARGAAVPRSFVGVWPQFAMFNHSCLSNTTHYVTGHMLVVRATEEVQQGAFLASYLDA